MDFKLTDYGHKQAFSLNEGLEPYIDQFKHIHSSDLLAPKTTAFYALGFPNDGIIKENGLLRECHFGKLEGVHYDNMSDEEKERFADPQYQFEGGESWQDVKSRVTKFLQRLPEDSPQLAFTHGGWMTMALMEHGVTQFPPNGSIAGVLVSNGVIESLDFMWEYPVQSEDI